MNWPGKWVDLNRLVEAYRRLVSNRTWQYREQASKPIKSSVIIITKLASIHDLVSSQNLFN